MEVIFESKAVVAQFHERGFVEIIAGEGHDLGLNDAIAIHDAIVARGHGEFRLLINRVHSYSTAESLLMLHSRQYPDTLFRLRPKKIACLIYQPVTEVIADFVGGLVFKRPYEVFQDRDAAIEWLMAD